MHIPETYHQLMQEPLVIEPVSDYGLIYPPVGFQPWPIGGIGNGDEYGYYWPIGKEQQSPLVAMMSHDCGALIPVASSMEALARLGSCPEVTALVTGEDLDGLNEELFEDSPSFSIEESLSIDSASPYLLIANADAAMASGDLCRAEELYLQAIDLLPEYSAAHYGLALLYRRQQNRTMSIHWMLEAIRSPLCFSGASFWSDTALPLNRSDYRKKCLAWLKQSQPQDSPSSALDPLFVRRDRFSFATGEKTIADFSIYDEIIDEYLHSDRTLDAIRLLMVVGELMMRETVSFRERNNFSYASFRQRLGDLCQSRVPERLAFL